MVKKIPMRMCTVCREMKTKKELFRVVKTNEGNIFVDLTFKANGRGAYICRCKECVEKAKKAKTLNKQFECQVGDEIYQQLTDLLNEQQN